MKTNVQSTWLATNCNSIDIHYPCKVGCHLPNLTFPPPDKNPRDIAIWGVKWFTPPFVTQNMTIIAENCRSNNGGSITT